MAAVWDGRCLQIEKAKQKSSPLKFRKSSNRSYSNTFLKLFLTHVWEQSSNFNCFCRVYVLTCCFSFYITRTLSRFLSTCPFLATPLWNGTVVQPNISVLHIALEVEVSSYSRHFWVICASTIRLSLCAYGSRNRNGGGSVGVVGVLVLVFWWWCFGGGVLVVVFWSWCFGGGVWW